METKQLAMQGLIFTHRRETNILTSLNLADLVDRENYSLSPDDSIATLRSLVETTDKQIFAVVEANRQLFGVVTFNEVRAILFEAGLHAWTPLAEIAQEPAAIVNDQDGAYSVTGLSSCSCGICVSSSSFNILCI
jgi:CIC family chloride channel protein